MVDRVGQQLGHYTILQLLGQGGFAEVYLGEHLYLKSQAAIKVLQTRLSSQDDMDSFLREAQTIARLSHPNIIRVLDFGVDSETPYLVMDYAPNGTLRQRHSKNTPIAPTTVVPYVKQVADALQYAHDEHLIHRDIKQENMLLGRRNEVLLSDFGIALVAQSSHSQRTQDVIGTVAYMSPEQIQGKPRPASDQYSLAIVVYEWLSGDRPFHGSFTELCTQHMFASPPPLREKFAQILPEVEHVVMKALNKDPKQRYERIQQFAQELEQACQSSPNVYNPSISSPNASYATSAKAGFEDAPVRPLVQHSVTPPPPPGILAAPQSYGQFNANATQTTPQFPLQQPPYAGASNAQVQPPGQAPQQHYPGPHGFQQNQAYPFASQQYAQPTNSQPYVPIQSQQQQGLLNQPTPYGSASSQQSPESTESTGDSWGILGEWKWHILATIIGIILAISLHNFRVTLWNRNTPVVLAIPLFFGAAFGPWVGLLVGVGSWFFGNYFYPGHDLLRIIMFRSFYGMYTWWIPPLLLGVTGFAAGLSMLKKRKYPTITSSIRACILTAIGLACCIGFILNQANALGLFLQIGTIALLNIGIGFVSLVVYSLVVRLIDAV
ncbi:MAG TPA: protein kinase [Ktedonobacteraceae bacterium]|nr:protein kinase [Ktedonobacteraceae bacterium]